MLRQTFAVGSETESVEEDANPLGGTRPVSQWTLTIGKFGIGDFFDGNTYSHDPRTQFPEFVWHPAYNRDRGPAHVLGARVHAEF